ESLSKDHRRKFDWKRANPVGTLIQLNKYPVVAGLIGSLIFIYIAAHSVQSTWSFFTMENFKWNEAMVGYSLGAFGILVALIQGGLIRIIIPKIGQKWSVYLGLMLYGLGLLLFGMARKGWMIFAFMIPYCLGGICGPALQSIISSQVPPNEQGELQGGLTSLMSVTAIFGPPLMTNIFSWFTGKNAPVYFPGAAFIAGALLTAISTFLAMRTLATYKHAAEKP